MLNSDVNVTNKSAALTRQTSS